MEIPWRIPRAPDFFSGGFMKKTAPNKMALSK
jgi:hypothetical protein